MNQNLTILRKTNSKNSKGNSILTYSTLSHIKGCLRTLSGSERYMKDKLTYNTTHTLYCLNTDIRVDDRVLYDSKTYEVREILSKSEGYVGDNKHLKVMLEHVTG